MIAIPHFGKIFRQEITHASWVPSVVLGYCGSRRVHYQLRRVGWWLLGLGYPLKAWSTCLEARELLLGELLINLSTTLRFVDLDRWNLDQASRCLLYLFCSCIPLVFLFQSATISDSKVVLLSQIRQIFSPSQVISFSWQLLMDWVPTQTNFLFGRV